jgi:predicted nucleic acid-binding protein
MILIVADTGPVNYFVQIGCIELLAKLADKVVLPAAVLAELRHKKAPEVVRVWAAAPPEWLEVRRALQPITAENLAPADREAISLALELNATVLLMDDQQARRCAAKLSVATIGTVGLLEAAAARDLILLPETMERLRCTSCFLSDEIVERALQRDAQRRGTPWHRESQSEP